MELQPLIDFYNTFNPASIGRLGDFYSEDAYFKDPFNEVRGVAAIASIFTHMFRQVEDPRFRVTETIADAQGAMLAWEFHFAVRILGRSHTRMIRGVSHLRFDAQGKVCHHRDYWDAAEELYATLPVIGCVTRGLARAFAAR